MELSQLDSILIIDDAEFDRQLLAKKLSAWNYNIYSAENGMAGLKALESHSPEIVITNTKVRNNRLTPKGERSSQKMYR